MSLDMPPAGVDRYGDQRGRIIGSYTATIALTFVFVSLRLLSRKLSRAGYWVRCGNSRCSSKVSQDQMLKVSLVSGTIY